MGGSTFTSGPNAVYTPRMPPAVYRLMRDTCQAKLRELFVCVATLIEGPEKSDYGDIDIMVALDKQPGRSVRDAVAAIGAALQAERAETSDKTAHFAIPWPEKLVEDSGKDPTTATPTKTNNDESILDASYPGKNNNNHTSTSTDSLKTKPRHIQVDVRICPSTADLHWMLFKHAHGDIWSLLGSTIRPFGLTVDDAALWLRVPEIEAVDRNKAKIFLTDDSGDVLAFLGLRQLGFWDAPFASAADLFEYVAGCRLFWVKQVGGDESEGDSTGAEAAGHPGGLEGGDAGRRKLKANDRRRMNNRPVFRRWTDEFLPRCRAEGRFSAPTVGSSGEPQRRPTRESVREDAFARFPGAREQYAERLCAFLKQQNEEVVWRTAIKGTVPEEGLDPQHRSVLVSALKKIVLLGDESFGIMPPAEVKTSEGLFDVEAVRRYIAGVWEAVEVVAWEKQLKRVRESMDRKGKRAEEKLAKKLAKEEP